jgi:hypothetical protein
VILAVASYGGSLSASVSAPPVGAYLLYLLSMLFASRLCLCGRLRRTLYATAVLAASVAVWITL